MAFDGRNRLQRDVVAPMVVKEAFWWAGNHWWRRRGGGVLMEDPAWCTSQRCCSVNFQAKIAQDWHSLVPVERFIDGKGGRKSLLKDYQVLAHFLWVRLGTASTSWLCVWWHSTNSNSVRLWEIAWWADTSTLGMWRKVLCLAVIV